MSDLINRSLGAITSDLANGTLSAVDLMQATLAQIEKVNLQVNAIVSLRDPDILLQEARKADQATERGPLHGVPMAIKDLSNARGLLTSMGSPAFAGQGPAPQDDIHVARVRAAGALIIGKTNVPEFGLGSHTFNPVFGATCNPYDLTRSAGGSSGGAAAALAARMLPVADGSDMMGSLRNPAAWCNVYGLRPTWGLVPNEPVGDMYLHTLATNGPMGRAPADIAALLQVQTGRDPRLPFGVTPDDVTTGLDAPIKGKRIGWLADWGGAYPMEPGILDLCQSALKVFEDQGAVIETLKPPFPAEKIWDSWQTLRWFAVAAKLAPLYNQDRTREMLKPAAQWEIENGQSLSAMQVQRASALRSDWFRAAMTLFDRYDAVVLPTAQVWPFPVDQVHPTHINDTPMDTYHRWMEVVIPASLIGLPALSVPVGFGESGLPMGMQLIGAPRADKTLLRMGHAYHQATLWPDKMPPNLP